MTGFYGLPALKIQDLALLSDLLSMIALIPRPLRFELARRALRLPLFFPAELKIRLARSPQDFAAVSRLLKAGLTKYHALPSTSILVLEKAGVVVATLSLIRSSAFGTPVDSHPDIAFFKESGARLVTLSSFAFEADLDDLSLHSFAKGFLDYARFSFGAEILAISSAIERFEMFEAILGFDRLPSHASGQVAVLKLNHLEEFYAALYEKRPRVQNFARFLALETTNVELPVRHLRKISDPVLTPELMKAHFAKLGGAFETLTEFEKQVLFDLYDSEEHRSVLPKPDREARDLVRRDKRFEVDLPSRVYVPLKGSIGGHLRNVSAHGLLFDSERSLREGERYTFQLPLPGAKTATVEGVILRNEVKRRYAIRIVEASKEWDEMIGYLESDLKQVDSQP